MTTLLMTTIEAARRGGVVNALSVERVIIETIFMPGVIGHPTDSRQLEECRQHLVKMAEEHGTPLRQNYNRIAPRLARSSVKRTLSSSSA